MCQQLCGDVKQLIIDKNIQRPLLIGIRTGGVWLAQRLQQALAPIFDNAIKFTDKGHLSLSVQIKFVDNQYLLLLKVEDTGIGIAENKREDILEAFTQGDGSDSRQFGGLGIGLSLVKALCNQLGGTITISSEVNYGTLVEISLPTPPPLSPPLLRDRFADGVSRAFSLTYPTPFPPRPTTPLLPPPYSSTSLHEP